MNWTSRTRQGGQRRCPPGIGDLEKDREQDEVLLREGEYEWAEELRGVNFMFPFCGGGGGGDLVDYGMDFGSRGGPEGIAVPADGQELSCDGGLDED